ncbi:MAG: methyltransferase [Thermoguttaceae bacterium]
MSYGEITFRDRNPVKRWLQQQRLVSAIKLCGCLPQEPRAICDFGAGNGELCKLLVEYYENAKLICYEPTPNLLSEAKQNLAGIDEVEFCDDIRGVAHRTFDLVFCLEVFEHLPPKETAEALRQIYDLLTSTGTIIIGVPVEVAVPAIYKGFFRMLCRYGAFDANIKNMLLSFVLRPPVNRPISEIAPGFGFHYAHMGFDYRRFKEILSVYFTVSKMSASPFAALGPWLMPEVYFVAEKTDCR